jgi:iron complex outermembrane receptor protein
MAAANSVKADPPKLLADPSFVDTRFMTRHDGLDLPPLLIGPQALLTAEHYFLARPPGAAEADSLRRQVVDSGTLVGSGGYMGNGAIATQSALARQDGTEGSAWAGMRHDHMHPYQDGGGGRINTSYDRLNSQLAASWRPTPETRLSGYAMRDGFSGFRLPNYGVDGTRLDRTYATTVLERKPAPDGFQLVQAALSFHEDSYDADNVTDRNRASLGLIYKGLFTATRALLRGQADGLGMRHTVTFDAGQINYTMDQQNLFPSQGTAAYRIPDVRTSQGALTWSGTTQPAPGATLTAGTRVDAWHSDVGKRSQVPGLAGIGAGSFAISPQQLWNSYYNGPNHGEVTNVNLSARLNYTQDLNGGSDRLSVDLRRLVRNPDNSERYLASTGTAATIQVGNPNLAPEAHHRLELGGRSDFGGFKGSFDPATPAGSARLAANVYVDRVMDFITSDRAHGQPGILKTNSALIYRDVDAYLTGAQLEGWWQAAPDLAARARLAWMRGENLTDSRPLYQVPPLEGEVVLDYRRPLFGDVVMNAGTRLAFAATQNRVDGITATGSAQDRTGATGGWATWDLFAGLALASNAAITGGVSNLLDKRYHLHVNPPPNGPTTTAMEAPGRTLYLMATIGF